MRVLVTGGTGFVGTHLVNELLRRKHEVTILARRPSATRNRYNRPVRTEAGDVLDSASLRRAFSGQDAIVHLVGIIWEKGDRTFDRLHRVAAENVVAAARQAGVRRLLHMSAMGSFPDSPSEYGRTKAAGEKVVRESDLDWTVIRPSIIVGPGDGFVTLLAGVIRGNPGFIPVIGPGTVRFMPVSVYDVARVYAEALEKPETIGKSFEVGGPHTLTLNEIYQEIAAAVGKPRKPLIHFPLWWGRFLAARFEGMARRGWLEAPFLTRDQLLSMRRDNTGDIGPTDAVFGETWREFRSAIREYLAAGRHNPRFGVGTETDLEPVKVLRVR
ncbi:MAG TPA: complex I NDUFA9 subunit family protein [Thermoanaerobaculia bacterium]|nr:complex I NDUFA9 subunit family protein [Thermoanaerobaculia bacterium]